jgi:hypothetical protein
MNTKKLFGILLLVLGIVLLGLVAVSVTLNMAQTGPWAYKITTYRPPFYAHGLWMVLFIAFGVSSLLGGSLMLAFSRYD